MTELKVWGWDGARVEAGKIGRNTQTREIVAARTGVEARRLSGLSEYSWRTYAERSDNDIEREVALSEPGAVFWIPEGLVFRSSSPDDWHRG